MWKWLKPHYRINFYTPTPLEECKNILLANTDQGAYSPQKSIVEKFWARRKKQPFSQIVIFGEKTDNQIPFRMHLHNQDIFTEYEIKGLLIPEGTGTRVRGISHIFRIDIQATIGFLLLTFAVMIFQVLLDGVDAFKYLSIILTVILIMVVIVWMITWVLVFFKGDRFRKLLGGEVSNQKPSKNG